MPTKNESKKKVAPIEETEWITSLLADYGSGATPAFLLHGSGTLDYQPGNLSASEYLARIMMQFSTVVQYAPDTGITFPGPSPVAKQARNRFIQTIAGPQGQSKPSQSEADKLMAAANKQGPSQQAMDEVELPTAPAAAIPYLIQFLEKAEPKRDENGAPKNERACVIIERMDLILPPSDKSTMSDARLALLGLLHRVGSSRALIDRSALLVMQTPSLTDIHPDLRQASSHTRMLPMPMPNYEQRLAFTLWGVKEYGEIGVILDDDVRAEDVAAQTAGLGLRHIENILIASLGDKDGKFGVVSKALIAERKKSLMLTEYAEVLEVLETNISMENVGGHHIAKAHLEEWVVKSFTQDQYREEAPGAILLLGPSGSGKTLLARALANRIGFNCVLLRPDKLKGGIVGESERRLAKALAGIEALAPVLVFVDEVDQSLPRRVEASAGDGGSAVEANQFGRLLEFISDIAHRGKILFVAASNRPDLIDAAMMRPGRLGDIVIPLLVPATTEERVRVLVALLNRHWPSVGQDKNLIRALGDIAEATVFWTQAALEDLVLRARRVSRLAGADPAQALEDAKRRTISTTRDVERMTRLAISATNDLDLIPPEYRNLVENDETPSTPSQTTTEESWSLPQRTRRSRMPNLTGFKSDEE